MLFQHFKEKLSVCLRKYSFTEKKYFCGKMERTSSWIIFFCQEFLINECYFDFTFLFFYHLSYSFLPSSLALFFIPINNVPSPLSLHFNKILEKELKDNINPVTPQIFQFLSSSDTIAPCLLVITQFPLSACHNFFFARCLLYFLNKWALQDSDVLMCAQSSADL